MTDNVCNVLEQRMARLQITGPPIRYNPISPYPTYTQSALDMRRKAEILQYDKNASKGNTLTKAQKFAGVMNRIKAKPVCTNTLYKPTPTSSCDVPGPVILLQYDPTVPLYNYANNADNYSNLGKDTTEKWSYSIDTDIRHPSYTSVRFMRLLIQDIDEEITTFALSVPIGIYVNGANTMTAGTVSIDNASLSVYYNKQLMTIPNPTMTIDGFSLSSRSMNYTPSGSTFNGAKYVGNLIISNIVLPTQSGYIYDFNLTFSTNVAIPNANVTSGVYTNVYANTSISTNCITTTTNTPVTRREFVLR